MPKYNVVSPVVNADTLSAMRAAALSGTGLSFPDGKESRSAVVISEKVTDKIFKCQTEDVEKIAAAGVSGMREKDGILFNALRLFFSRNYGGKMYHMPGLSGFAGNNRRCILRAMGCGVCSGVCEKCFSFTGSKFSNLNAWTKNDVILSTAELKPSDVVIDPEKIPAMRFSTHGDLINPLHAYNDAVMAYANPGTQFTLWTKNHYEYSEGMRMFSEKYGPKPRNLRVYYSGVLLDQMYTDTQLKALKARGYDGIFSVYTRWFYQDAAVSAGAFRCVCGKGSCAYRCNFCYQAADTFPADPEKAVWIAEILDGEKHKE